MKAASSPAGEEGDVIAQYLVARRRLGIGPRHRADPVAADDRVEAARRALELAQDRACPAVAEQIRANVLGREVERRRVAHLEHGQRAGRIGEGLAAELDPDAGSARHNRRRAG
jgi:hypothetical protein